MIRGSIPCGRITGIDVRIHVTFLLLLGFIAWAAWSDYGLAGAGWSVAFTLSLFLCILLHELGHCWVARRFKVPVRSITLLPIGGVASMGFIPERPSSEFLIAIAGPAVNVVIAAALLLAGRPWPGWDELGTLPLSTGELLEHVLRANLVLVAFNAIPAFPMDGGRVFRSLLAVFLPHARATFIAARLGQLLAIGFVALGVMVNPVLCLIGLFVFWGAGMEEKFVRVKDQYRGRRVEELMDARVTPLDGQSTLGDAIRLLHEGASGDFPVVIHGHLAGFLAREDLVRHVRAVGPSAAVTPLMKHRFLSLRPDADVSLLYTDRHTVQQGVFPVLDEGRVVGMLRLSEARLPAAPEPPTPTPPRIRRITIDIGE